MAIGIIIGALVPSAAPTLQKGQFVGVSVPIAIGLLIMMYIFSITPSLPN